MATTLRINEALFREAKAEAARMGVTLTRFIEDSLRQKLGRTARVAQLPFYDSGIRLKPGFDLKALTREEETTYMDRIAEKLPPYGSSQT
jgi:antitoxin component of RelBE/YafQ-DinJ toxin-antitoxin module